MFLFGYQPEQVIGQPVEILLPEALREHHSAVHRKGYMRAPYPRAMGANLDLQARHRDGSTFPVLIDLHPEMSETGELYVRAAIQRKGEPDPVARPSHGCPVVVPPENGRSSAGE
jgi:PAS domain S-box-containing protein